MNKLGSWLREKRKNLAYSQVDFAEQVGLSQVTISKIENGEHVSYQAIRKLSEFTGIGTKNIRDMMLMETTEAVDEEEER